MAAAHRAAQHHAATEASAETETLSLQNTAAQQGELYKYALAGIIAFVLWAIPIFLLAIVFVWLKRIHDALTVVSDAIEGARDAITDAVGRVKDAVTGD